MLGVAGNDFIVGQAGVDNFNAGEGNDRSFARDGVAEAVTLWAGDGQPLVDTIDTQPAGDCETFSAAAAAAAERSLDRKLRSLER